MTPTVNETTESAVNENSCEDFDADEFMNTVADEEDSNDDIIRRGFINKYSIWTLVHLSPLNPTL